MSLTRTRPERDTTCPRGLLACAGERPTSARLTPDAEYGVTSKVRTVCSSSCKYGSVRGVAGNGHPYRDGFSFNRRRRGFWKVSTQQDEARATSPLYYSSADGPYIPGIGIPFNLR